MNDTSSTSTDKLRKTMGKRRERMEKDNSSVMEMDESVGTASTKSSESINSNKSIKSKSNKKRHRKRSKKGSKKQKQNRKHVEFSNVQVLEFNYTIAHQSVTEKGPPVGLSSNLVHSQEHDIDSYEHQKEQQIFTTNGELSSEARFQILSEHGFSRSAIEQADEESKRVRVHRKQSVLNMRWDDRNERRERIHRRVKRWTNPKTLYSKGSDLLWGSSNRESPILSY